MKISRRIDKELDFMPSFPLETSARALRRALSQTAEVQYN